MPSVRDRYLIGKLGSYDTSTVARVDSHLRALRHRLTTDITPRLQLNVWADINELLQRRHTLTETA
jgi:hypothetical protein